jgi:hypothetical protein
MKVASTLAVSQQPSSYKLSNPLNQKYQHQAKPTESDSKMRSLVDKMEEKYASQVRKTQYRKPSTDENPREVSSNQQEHMYRSRAYQSAINEVYAGMPSFSELQAKKKLEHNYTSDRVAARENSRANREKEASDRSNIK